MIEKIIADVNFSRDAQDAYVLNATTAEFTGDVHFSEAVQNTDAESIDRTKDILNATTRRSQAYGGTDVNVYLNDEPINEMNSINFTENLLTGGGAEGVCRVVLYAKVPFFHKRMCKGVNTLELRYVDEYGNRVTQSFNNFTLVDRKGGFHINDIASLEEYTFTASSVTVSEPDKVDIMFPEDYEMTYDPSQVMLCKEEIQ